MHRSIYAAIVGLGALVSTNAYAVPFTVNSFEDKVDNNLADGVCAADNPPGSPPGTVTCTLRAAIMQANATPAGLDTITLGPGTYALTWNGAGEDNARTGDLDIKGPLGSRSTTTPR